MKTIYILLQSSLRGTKQSTTRTKKLRIQIVITLLTILSFASYSQISRTQMINNAVTFTSFSWSAATCNIWSGTSCGGGNIYTAPWITTAGTYISLPYCWGGWSSLTEYATAISNCKSAGQVCSASGGGCSGVPSAPLSCAGGQDCSGFVTRVWERTSKYSTSTLPNISSSIPLSQTQPGDIVNLAGSHVRLVETNYGNGNYRVIEASGADWKVAYHTYTAIQLSSYDPRCANSNIVIGGCGTIDTVLCDNDNSCGPPTPTVLAINYSCISSSCSTIGATYQSPDIQYYGGSSCTSLYQSGRTDDDVWFTITPTDTIPITITVNPTSGNIDPCVGVYSGICSAPTQLACADLYGNMVLEQLTFTPISGTTYLIRVFGYDIGAYSGDFDICAYSTVSTILENNLADNFSVYPNPTNGLLNIKYKGLKNDNYKIILTNNIGQILKEKYLKSSNNFTENQFDISEFSSGLYFITIYSTKINKVFKVQKL